MYRSVVVQDLETDEESSVSLQDTTRASPWREDGGNATEDAFWASETLLQALISILNLSSLLTGRAKNTDRQEYFWMFFTDNAATGLHQGEVPDLFRKRERDLFQALEIRFLDYFIRIMTASVPPLLGNRSSRNPLSIKTRLKKQRHTEKGGGFFMYCPSKRSG